MFVFPPGTWWLLEYVFMAIGLVLTAILYVQRRLSLKRTAVWVIGYILIPIVTFAVWMMVGKPLFLKQGPAYVNKDADTYKKQLEIDPGNKSLRIASELGSSGSYEMTENNHCTYLQDGAAYFEKLFHDIENAMYSIFVEMYIIRTDKLSNDFIDLLCGKAREGVSVKVIFDDFGYDAKDFEFVHRLEKSGAKCGIFHNMTKTLFSPLKNYRNHRKMFIIDDKISYVSGFNVGEEYIGKGPLGKWADSALKLVGDQTAKLRELFSRDWMYTTNSELEPPRDAPFEDCGNTQVITVPGNPVRISENPIRKAMLSLINNAEKSILIRTPYLAPSEDLMEALCRKSKEGVDVRIMIPYLKDHPCTFWVNRWYAFRMMQSGIHVFEYNNGFLHCKDWCCDGRTCSIGSANFDMRSLDYNFEVNQVVFSEEIAKQIEERFDRELENCTEYNMEAYLARTRREKFRTSLSLIFRTQL